MMFGIPKLDLWIGRSSGMLIFAWPVMTFRIGFELWHDLSLASRWSCVVALATTAGDTWVLRCTWPSSGKQKRRASQQGIQGLWFSVWKIHTLSGGGDCWLWYVLYPYHLQRHPTHCLKPWMVLDVLSGPFNPYMYVYEWVRKYSEIEKEWKTEEWIEC